MELPDELLEAVRALPLKSKKSKRPVSYVGTPADAEVLTALNAIRSHWIKTAGPGLLRDYTTNAAILCAALLAYADNVVG